MGSGRGPPARNCDRPRPERVGRYSINLPMSQAQGRSKQPIRGAKAQVRGGKKAARRPPVKSTTDVPILALVVGGVLLALFVGLIIYGAINNQKTTIPSVHGSSGDIPCDHLEQTQIHYHSAIQIVSGGTL